MRLKASQDPLNAPYFSIACMAYSEQVGMYLQQGLDSGDMDFR